MGASESKPDAIDVDVDVADAPVDKTPTPINSTLSEDNLGHPRPPRTDSTLYADKVGKEFASKQPEHEVTAADASQFAAQGVAPGVGPVYH